MKNSDKIQSFEIHKRYYLYASILELLSEHSAMTENELRSTIIDQAKLSDEILWGVSSSQIAKAAVYLGSLDLVGVHEPNKLEITDSGRISLTECRFQNLAASTFFNYKTLKWAIKATVAARIAATGAVVAALVMAFELWLKYE